MCFPADWAEGPVEACCVRAHALDEDRLRSGVFVSVSLVHGVASVILTEFLGVP